MRQKPRVAVAHHLAEIGDLADLPEQPHRAGIGRQHRDFGIARQQLQRPVVVGVAHLHQARRRRPLVEALQQRADRIEAQIAVAPGNPGQRLEAVLLDRRDDLRFEQALVGRRAERAVAHVPSGAPGDLADFGRRQAARAAPVEFREAGKGDMVEIHVQPHADRVGRDEVIDLAGLEHPDLRVARPRAERAEHDRGAAALPPHQLGQREHVGEAERDDGAAARQPRHLLVPGIGQVGKTRAADILDIRHEAAHQRLYRVGAEKHRFGRAAGVQQPGREDVAALGVGAELDLVHREKLDRAVERHRFDRADEIGRVRRQDFFFAGDQRDGARAAQFDNPVVVFARQQAQRKPDHPARMIEHALDGKMRLAGIGRPENRDEARRRTEHGHGHKGAASLPAGQVPWWGLRPLCVVFSMTCGVWSGFGRFGINLRKRDRSFFAPDWLRWRPLQPRSV